MKKTRNPNNLKKRYAVVCAQIEADDESYDKATDPNEKFNIDQGLYVKWGERVRLERLICASPGDAIFKLKIALGSVAIIGDEPDLNWMLVQSALQDLENLPVPPTPLVQHSRGHQTTQPECRVAV